MTNKNILLKLQELSANNKNRSMTARLSDLHEAIEETLKKGISRALVIKELNSNGFDVKPTSFNTILARLRKKRSKELANNLKPNYNKTINKPTEEKSMGSTKPSIVGSHDPKDLDKIFASKPDLDALSRLAKKNRAEK